MAELTEAAVKAMTESELYDALSRINGEIKSREEGGFAELVLDYLRETDDAEVRAEVADCGGAVAVLFGTDSWDNGFFYNEHSGVVTLAEGSTMEVDFAGTGVDDALTELSAIARRENGLCRSSELRVDLVTGKVEHL